MRSCVQFCTRNVLCMFASIGLLVSNAGPAKINLERYRLPVPFRSITGHLHLLRQCRRQLTFIASVALGTFITRFIKESPLTPLPMPPLEDPPRWNFLKLPLHAANPYLKWMPGYAMKSKNPHQNSGFVPHSWKHRNRFENSIDDLPWTKPQPRFRRDLTRRVKTSISISHAVSETLKYFGSALVEEATAKQWLMRWCH